MDLKIKIEGTLLRNPESILNRLFDGIESDLRIGGQSAVQSISALVPVNSGALRQSVTSEIFRPKFRSIYLEIGSAGGASRYALPVEMGTQPHYPPIAPLKLWVKRKLHLPENYAYAIAQRIAGMIPGRPGGTSLQSLKETGKWGRWMFRRGFEGQKDNLLKLVYSGIHRRLRELQ